MTPLKFVIGFSLLTLSACGQKPAPHKADPSAVALNNQAMALVPYVEDTDSSKKALALLDQATSNSRKPPNRLVYSLNNSILNHAQ